MKSCYLVVQMSVINATSYTESQIKVSKVVKLPELKQSTNTLILVNADLHYKDDMYNCYEIGLYSIDATDGNKILERKTVLKFKKFYINPPIQIYNDRWYLCELDNKWIVIDKKLLEYRIVTGPIRVSIVEDLICFDFAVASFGRHPEGYGWYNPYPRFYYHIPTNTVYDAKMNVPTSLSDIKQIKFGDIDETISDLDTIQLDNNHQMRKVDNKGILYYRSDIQYVKLDHIFSLNKDGYLVRICEIIDNNNFIIRSIEDNKTHLISYGLKYEFGKCNMYHPQYY